MNGPAIGFGMDLALLCDIRIASATARFSQAYVRMGLVADVAGLWLLPRLVGPAIAAQLLLTGDIIDAAEAEAIGLVSQVVDAEDLLTTAIGVAGRIAAKPPLAVAATKEGHRRAVGRSADDLDDLAAIRGVRLRQPVRERRPPRGGGRLHRTPPRPLPGALMDFGFTAAEERFREHVRAWLAEHLTAEQRAIRRTYLASPEAWKRAGSPGNASSPQAVGSACPGRHPSAGGKPPCTSG